jgi:HK97 family phage prohead protease
METLYIEASSIECSEDRREISGKIVPLGTGEIGQTNLGAYTFEAGSIEIEDVKAIKLFSQHDMKKPIGRMISAETRDGVGIFATFKLSRSTGGNDALVMAQEGLVTGMSIGAEIISSKPSRDGHTVVTAAKLKEVSLVTEPAFKSAQVLEIAAEEAPAEAVEETLPTESETVVEDTTVEATPVEAAAVEAARPTVQAMVYSTPRIEVTKRNYLENTLKANVFGDEDSRQWLRAADNDQTTGAGFIPTPQSTQLLNFLSNADRPVIDSISRGTMPEFGKSFELPKITEVPLVSQIDENDPVTESQLEASYITVTKKSFKGRAITTLELLSNSTPAFLDELLVQMENAYAKDTETYAIVEMSTAGTLNATPQANSADGLLKYISSAAAAVYKASLGFARNLVVTPEQWANIMSYNDGGRPIYIAANPQNAGGSLSPTAVRGNVAGLDLRVSRIISPATADYSMVVINPDAYTWYEGARQQLRTNINSDGTVDVLLFGQGALATKLAAGANWFNFT